MRPSIRFEVFKRDDFVCQYCGRRTPDVVLEVDHVIPRVEGGGDELDNLITACFECNRGKGKELLSRVPAQPDLADRASLLREREQQLRAYHEAQSEIVDRQAADLARVWEYWFTIWRAESMPHYHVPNENSLRRYIEALGPDQVIDAMDVARAKFRWIKADAVRYFFGVCKRKLAREEGRVVQCKYCQRDIVLEPGDDATLTWWHSTCGEKADG